MRLSARNKSRTARGCGSGATLARSAAPQQHTYAPYSSAGSSNYRSRHSADRAWRNRHIDSFRGQGGTTIAQRRSRGGIHDPSFEHARPPSARCARHQRHRDRHGARFRHARTGPGGRARAAGSRAGGYRRRRGHGHHGLSRRGRKRDFGQARIQRHRRSLLRRRHRQAARRVDRRNARAACRVSPPSASTGAARCCRSAASVPTSRPRC